MSDYELVHAYETVNLQRAGGVARIELNRPDDAERLGRARSTRDLKAAFARVADDDERARRAADRRRPRLLLRRRPVAPASTRTPDGQPDLADRRCASATTRSSRRSASCRSRSSRPSTAAAVGIGCSLALACDLILARRVGLLPARVREHRPRPRRRLLAPSSRRASGSPARPRWRCSASASTARRRSSGAWSTRVHPDDELDGRGRRARRRASRPARRASYAGAKRQLNAWRLRRPRRAARARGVDPAGAGADRRLRRGRARPSWRSAPAGLRRAGDAAVTRAASLCAALRRSMSRIRAALRPESSLRRRLVAALLLATTGSLVCASGAFADFLTPESGGSPNADQIDSLYKIILYIAIVVFVGRRGRAALLAHQVPRQEGPRRRPDPRQHAPGDRLDGRRRADPRRR